MAERDPGPEEVREPGTTGRYVITIDPTATQQGLEVLDQQVGVSLDETAEAGEVDAEALTNPEASVFLPDLGILIVGGLSAEQVSKVQALTKEDNPVLAIVPERSDYRALRSPSDSAIR
jgi:hypothetical protein